MSGEVDTVTRIPDPEAGSDRTIRVALGRRVEVIGDLLLPPEPTDSSRAACRDIGRRLEDWQGPGIVILCGRLVAPGCQSRVGPAAVLGVHPELMDALRAFAARADSQVVVVMAAAESDPELVRDLERSGLQVHDAVDLACETGAGTRTVLVRAGTMGPDANPPMDATPSEERPWLAGMERLDDPRLARRFVTSRLLYRRLRRYLWQPPRPHGEQPRERVVGPLELFYDLAVVVLVAQAAHRLAGHLTWAGLGQFAVVFTLVWIAWANGSLHHELHGHDEGQQREQQHRDDHRDDEAGEPCRVVRPLQSVLLARRTEDTAEAVDHEVHAQQQRHRSQHEWRRPQVAPQPAVEQP